MTASLTGAANLSALFAVLWGRIDAGSDEGCRLLFCDLDERKAVNDRPGTRWATTLTA
jgi:predicted signal transduction protein with EAL and GGDEF domain